MSQATSKSMPPRVLAQRTLLRGAARIPASALAAFRRFTTVNAAGDRLEPEMAAVGFATAKVPGMQFGAGPLDVARRNTEESAMGMAEVFPPLAVEEDLEFESPGGRLHATRYRAGTTSNGIILYFHGGGWVLGSRVSHDPLVRRLAVDTGADVVSVEYRLAPEHPFPAAVDDALAAWRFVVDAAPRWGVSPDKIVVSGDSAGGNLSAVLCLDLRGEDTVPALQALFYPVTDLTRRTASREEFAEGYFLTDERMTWFSDQYVPDVDRRSDPRASPLLADDLAGLPPAYIVVAGFDPLRDEGLAYADRLREAGVSVTLDRAGGLIHGFANMGLISPVARDAVARVSGAIVSALA